MFCTFIVISHFCKGSLTPVEKLEPKDAETLKKHDLIILQQQPATYATGKFCVNPAVTTRFRAGEPAFTLVF